MALSAPGLEVVDVVYDAVEPYVYVFANVKGALNVTKPNNQIQQFGAFNGMEAYWRSMILRYDSDTLAFVDNAQMGTYQLNGPGDPGEDFTMVRGLWANGTLWAAYNLGPSQGNPSSAIVAFYKNSTSGNNFALPAGTAGNTGVMRIRTSNLLPDTASSVYPGIFSFGNLTSTSFHFDGVHLYLSGSFVLSPLVIPELHLDETVGVRNECHNASHGQYSSSFQWCAGDEDGWDIQIGVNGNTGTVTTPHFVFSQNTLSPAPATPPSRRVKALSVSTDVEGTIYACYSSNNEFLVTADAGDHASHNASTIAFNHTQNTPSDNLEAFCTLRTRDTFSFTAMGMNGEISNILTGALPTASKQLYYASNVNAGTASAITTFNITAVQDVGQEMGYTMQTASGGSATITNVLTRSSFNDIVVSGVFKGTLTGDVAAPILHVTGETATKNLFVFYYNRTDSPTQITPSAVFSLSGYGVDFDQVKTFHHVGSTGAAPKLLITSTFTASQIWTFNNTIYAPSPNGAKQFVWGLYQPETNTVPGPVFVIPHPSTPSVPPTAAPVAHAPSTSSNAHSAPYPSYSITILVLIALLAVLVLRQ